MGEWGLNELVERPMLGGWLSAYEVNPRGSERMFTMQAQRSRAIGNRTNVIRTRSISLDRLGEPQRFVALVGVRLSFAEP